MKEKKCCFRRYCFFGFVDVNVYFVKSSSSLVNSLSIIDNFSLEKLQLTIIESAAIDYVDFTDQCIFFFISLTGKVFACKNKLFFSVQRSSSNETWKWTELDVDLRKSELQVAEKSSSLLRQWSHWDGWMAERIIPSVPEQSLNYFLVCTLFSVFFIENDKSGRAKATIEKIHDSRISKSLQQKYMLDFRVKQACTGNDHVVLLDFFGAVYTCGTGNHGELGHAILESELKPKKVEMFTEADISILQVAAGGWHSCALTSEGDVYGWGWNSHGQLGYSPEEFTIQTIPHPFDIDQTVRYVNCRNNVSFLEFEDGGQIKFGELQEL